MTTPNLTAQADVALDHMAGTLADTYARAAVAFDGIDSPTTGNTMAEVVASLDPDPWARDGAQSSTIKPAARANAGSGVAPLPGVKSHTLTLPYPISANRYWNSFPLGKRIMTAPSAEAKKYKRDVALIAKAQGIRQPIAGRVRIDLKLYPNRPQDWQKRQRKDGAAWDDTVQCLDLDNARKVVYDSLKGVVIEDDKWVRQDSGERMEPDEHGARLVLTVTALTTDQPQTDLFGAA